MKEGTGRYPLKEKYVYVVSLEYMFGETDDSIGSVTSGACLTFEDAVQHVLDIADDLIHETCDCMDYDFKQKYMLSANVNAEVFQKIYEEHKASYNRNVHVLVYQDPVNSVSMVMSISRTGLYDSDRIARMYAARAKLLERRNQNEA